MKNLSHIVNIVLAAALIVVFALHFSLRSKVKALESQPIAAKAGIGNIVYLNIDSLYAKYSEYIDIKAQIEDKQKKMSDELGMKQKSLQNNVAEYKDKAQKGLLLRSEMEKVEQQLAAQEQNLYKMNEQMQGQLNEELQVLNSRLHNNIVEYLKDYNKNGRFLYIMSYQYANPNILYVNDSLDITQDVLKGLNEKYNKKK